MSTDEYSHIQTENDLRQMTIVQLRGLMTAWHIPLLRPSSLKQQYIDCIMRKLKERRLIAQTRERVTKDIEMGKKGCEDGSDGEAEDINNNNKNNNNKTYTKKALESMTKEELVKVAERWSITTIHFASVSKEQLVEKLFDIQKERNRIALRERHDPLSKYHKGAVEYTLPISLILIIIRQAWKLETNTKLIRYAPSYTESFQIRPSYKQAVRYGMICKQIFKFVSKSLYNSIYIVDGNRVEDYQRRLENPYCLAKSLDRLYIHHMECKLFMDPSPTIIKVFSGVTKLVLSNTRISILNIMQTLKHVSKFEFAGQLQDSDYEMVAKWWLSLESVNFLQCTTLDLGKFFSFIDHQRFKKLILPYQSSHFSAAIPDSVKSSLVRFGPIPHSLPTELTQYPNLEKLQIFNFGMDINLKIPKLNNTVLDYTCNIRKFTIPISSNNDNNINEIFHLFSLMPKLEIIVDACKHCLLEPWKIVKHSSPTIGNKSKVIQYLELSKTIKTVVMYFEFTFSIIDSQKEYYPVQYRNTLDECGFAYKGEVLPLQNPSIRHSNSRNYLSGCRKVYFNRVDSIIE